MENYSNDYLLEIARLFISEPIELIKKHGNGLINNTYKIVTADPTKPNYLLQQINHNIFKDVDGLQDNIKRVTDHIREKVKISNPADYQSRVLNPVTTLDGKLYYKDTQGNYWRVFTFLENTVSHEQMTTPKLARIAGAAFGNFHKQLSDFPGETLCEVIPGFHHTPMRIENLRKRVAADPVGRLKEVQEEVDFLLGRSDEFSKVAEMGKAGILPQRVVHQDTKFNNVLLDKDDNVMCIIDLDTVMPGYICIDVGDAIRTGANRGAEDDKNLDNVSMNIDIFRGFIEGFVSETKSFITPQELETLALGPKLLAYEQAVRFLDDFIDGDNYYKTQYPEHNLVRTRAQIKLLRSMDEQYDAMQAAVKSVL